jgi:hypothetical protein
MVSLQIQTGSFGEPPLATPSASDLTLELELDQYKTRPKRWVRSEFNATFSIGFGNGLYSVTQASSTPYTVVTSTAPARARRGLA